MHRIDRRTLAVVAAGGVAVLATRAFAQESHDHHADDATASPEAELGTGTGVVYMTIENRGDEADTLVSASTEAARSVMLHRTETEGTTSTMEHMDDGLEIAAGETVALEPGGYHLMLVDLNEDLLPDITFSLELTFAVAGKVELTVPVVTERLDDVPPVEVGDLELTGYWSRPAPRLTPSSATPSATPKG